ncbi:MAG TPA: ferrous iron transporter B, partial [Eubacteriaceae bacterium]|nr:ferrous iron transporter B [Eubacteriaceae bacterium]
FIPMGLVGWQLAAAAITGFVAKENVVATFAVVMGLGSEQALQVPGGALTSLFTPITAYAFLAFNLFTPPCFAAIGAMNSELGSKKWLFKGLAFQLSVGYVLSILIAQIGTLILEGSPGFGFVPTVFILVFYAVLLIYLIKRSDEKRRALNDNYIGKVSSWEQ